MKKAGADLGFSRNSSALIVLEKTDRDFRLVLERVWIPLDVPLKPRLVIDEIVNAARNRQCQTLCADIHYIEDLSDQLEDTGVELMQFTTKPEDISRAWFVLKDLLAEGRLDLSTGSQRLKEQILRVEFKPAPGGYFQIIQPEVSGAHGDVLQALVHCLYAFGSATESMVSDGARRFPRSSGPVSTMSMTSQEYESDEALAGDSLE